MAAGLPTPRGSAGSLVPKQRCAFEFVERTLRGDIAPGIGNPLACDNGAGHAHCLGQCLVNIAEHQCLTRALDPRIAARTRGIGSTDFDKITQLTAKPGPKSLFRIASPQRWLKRVEARHQRAELDRIARSGDDRCDRGLVLRPELPVEKRLKITKGDTAIDRPSGGEHNHQRIGAVR